MVTEGRLLLQAGRFTEAKVRLAQATDVYGTIRQERPRPTSRCYDVLAARASR
jgi:hypothetical protein